MKTETQTQTKRVRRLHLWEWLALAAVLGLAVALIAPQQLPVLAYKVLMLSVAALAGYALDRSLFPYARPDVVLDATDAPWLPPEVLPELSVDFGEGETRDWNAENQYTRLEQRRLHLGLLQWCMARRALLILGAMLAVGLGA